MIKRLLLSALFCIAAVPAFAACSSPVVVKDGSGSNVSMSMATGADTNCQSKIDWDTSSQAHADMTAAIPAGTNLIGDVNLRQGGTALSATNPTFTRMTDGTNARVMDPCQIVAHVYTRVDIASAASSVLVAGTSSKKTYICGMMLFSAGTTNVGIIEGSGSTCGTSPLGLIGGNTAAKGPNLTAQTGFVAGTGLAAIAGTTVNANDICLINSAAIQVSGYIITATP